MKLTTILLCLEASHTIGGKEAYIGYLNTFKSIIRELITIIQEDTETLKGIDTYNPGTLRAKRFSKWWSDNYVQFTGAIRAIQEHRRQQILPKTKELLDIGRTIYKADAARRNELTANSDRSIGAVYMLPDVLNELGFHNIENIFSDAFSLYNKEFDNAKERLRVRMRDQNGRKGDDTRTKSRKMDDHEPIPANARFIDHDAMPSSAAKIHQTARAEGLVEQTIRRLPLHLQDAARKHVAKSNNKLIALRDFLTRNGINQDSLW